MSKDTINPKRWILTQEQIDALLEWKEKADQIKIPYQSNWLAENPCPLPNPVEIPSEISIKKIAKNMSDSELGVTAYNSWINGAKWLRDLIFNKQ